MDWKLTSIPKTCHLYWGGGKLPYLRYLTIATFKHYNPDWEIILHKPKIQYLDNSWTTHEQEYDNNYDDYTDKVEGVSVREMDFETIGFRNDASEVHKSDFIRWNMLSIMGGIWVDMDVLFIKPMTDLYFNTDKDKDVNTVFCIEPSKLYHSIGFLMSSAGNEYFGRISEASMREYRKEHYQCMGSELLNKMFPTLASARLNGVNPLNLSMDVVYAYNCSHVKELFAPVAPSKFTRNSIGIHWYAGHKLAGEFLNKTNGGLSLEGDSIMNRQIRKFQEYEK